MAINKRMRKVLAAISYAELDVTKDYKRLRRLTNIANRHFLRPSYRIWDHEVSAGTHAIPVRIFSPVIPGEYPILIFFHGGGWVTGNIDSYDRVCTYLADRTSHTVVSVDYRLAPEYRFPAGLEDCYRVTEEIYMHPELFGCATCDITLVGDSAGGNLAAAVSLMARDRGQFLPDRQILIYPSLANDHSETVPYESVREYGSGFLLSSKRVNDFMELYRSDEQDLSNPYFAPLVGTDFSRQPKTLIITAEYDPLRDEGEAYGAALRAAGVPVEIHRIPNALHGFFSLGPRFSSVKRAYEHILEFLRRR